MTFDGKETVTAQRAVVQGEFEMLPEAPLRLVDLASDVKGDAALDRALAEVKRSMAGNNVSAEAPR